MTRTTSNVQRCSPDEGRPLPTKFFTAVVVV